MSNYNFHVTEVSLRREDDSIVFGESVTKLALDDEAGGLFLTITQDPSDFGPGGKLRFDFDEIEKLYEAMKYMKTVAERIQEDDKST